MARGRKRIAFVGGTEKGKSTQAKKMLLARVKQTGEALIILDPNYQTIWSEFPEINFELLKVLKKGIYRINSMEYETFFETIFNYNACEGGRQVLSEDSSNWATPQKNVKIYPIFIGLRHPKQRTDLTLIFHAVKRVPAYIMEQLNEMILFKTNDTWEAISDRIPDNIREEFKAAFFRVNSHPDPFYFERIIIQKTGTI